MKLFLTLLVIGMFLGGVCAPAHACGMDKAGGEKASAEETA